jgi:hypothetical protein
MHLNIPEIIAQLDHINTRSEKHGEEDVLACDLNISVVMSAHDMLEQLCIGNPQPLLDAFWDAKGQASEPTISAIKLNHKLKDHTFKISIGIDDAITCEEVTLKRFSWIPENGHTMKLKFQVGMTPDEEDFAHIASGLKKNVQITVIPPAQMDIEEMESQEEEGQEQAKEKPARKRRRAAA